MQDARCSQKQRELSLRIPQKANQALEDQREFFVDGGVIRSVETRRAIIQLPYRTASSRISLGRRHATTKSRTFCASVLDSNLIDLDKEKQNFYEKNDEK